MKRCRPAVLAAILLAATAKADEPARIRYSGTGTYMLVERSDLRRYDNGKYTGLVNREIRSFITPAESPDGRTGGDRFYTGNFYVSQDTRRNSGKVGDSIHEAVPAAFRISPDGNLVMTEDHGYPTFRSFPAFTEKAISPGDRWQSKAERTVDPLGDGRFTRIPMYIEYTYIGNELFNGEEMLVLRAKWATRYGISYIDFGGDPELTKASGSHNATMYVSRRTGNAAVVRDTVDETFFYSGGRQITYRGTISLFTEYPPATDRSRLIPAISRAGAVAAAEPAGKNETETAGRKSAEGKSETGRPDGKADGTKPEIKVDETESGIRLTMSDLKFKADSAELLPGEDERLDLIASILMEAPESMFLVEGHTAATGNEKGEMRLSLERAKATARSLAARGIPEGKFICHGSGSHRPVADNATAGGKAANRRVEITILE